MRKLHSIVKICFICLLCCAMVASCSILAPTDKEFTKEGMTITLTSAFKEEDTEGMTASYLSTSIGVSALKESFESFEDAGASSSMPLKEYAELVIEANEFSSTITEKEGITCFNYEDDSSGENFIYLGTVHRSGDAYWYVQFYCQEKDYEKNESTFLKWAKSIKFD